MQFRTRTTLTDVDIAGVIIPTGATVALLLAAGSRDPSRVPDADRFVPDRTDNAHLGFGGGIHYCVGAPLARLEAQIALRTLARRLVGPRPSPTRRPTARKRPCAAPGTSSSRSTA